MLVNGAVYTLHMVPAAFSTAGDILEIRTPADAIIIPIHAHVAVTVEELSEQIEVDFSTRATAGTGGVSRTPVKHSEHFIASQCVCLEANSTDAAGTQKIIVEAGGNLLGAGWEWNGDGSFIVPISTSLILGFGTAPTAAKTISASVTYMELGQ